MAAGDCGHAPAHMPDQVSERVALSVVIPALNEREALPALLEEIEQTCASLGRWEVIVVDDGSTDGSFELVEQLAAERPWLRGVRLRRNFGKSAALATGFAHSNGEMIVTIDGDGQDDPADIPALLERLEAGGRHRLRLEARPPRPGQPAVRLERLQPGRRRASRASRCTT